MTSLGVLAGLAAAACNSGSYLFSRLFVLRVDNAVPRLLVLSHILMGLASLALLPLVWSSNVPPLPQFLAPLLGTAFFYLLGQAGFFALVRRTDASRVAPLLAFKIVVLALISTLAMGQHVSLRQWVAVGLCLASAFLVNAAGARLSIAAVLYLGATCTFYSLSDLSIAVLITNLHPLSRMHAALFGVCTTYIICGAVALLLLPVVGARRALEGWRYACPFAGFWLLAMFFLFICFSLLGTVFGNVVQSMRGVISVALGAGLARMGFHELEQPVSRRMFGRRLAAAGMMCLAVWLYQSGNGAG